MSSKTIVVFASTGLQGSALIKALSDYNIPQVQYSIHALSRNASSPSSAKLAEYPGVTVRQVPTNYMDVPMKTFEDLGLEKGKVYGVFSNQGYVDDKTMIAQGKAIADTAKEYEVKHLVYASVVGENTGVDALEAKHQVEEYISSLSLPHTYLRPVQFMENYLPTAPFLFKIGRTVIMRYTYPEGSTKKHQLIASKDIGVAAALAFVNGPEWMGGKIDLAGESLTVKEIDQVFEEELGEPVRVTYGLLARIAKANVPILGQMSKFFGTTGTNVDVSALKREISELQDLRTFLRVYKEKQEARG